MLNQEIFKQLFPRRHAQEKEPTDQNEEKTKTNDNRKAEPPVADVFPIPGVVVGPKRRATDEAPTVGVVGVHLTSPQLLPHVTAQVPQKSGSKDDGSLMTAV